jgi:hypothetical protein
MEKKWGIQIFNIAICEMKRLDMNLIISLKIILEIRELIILNNDLKSTAFEVSFRLK